MMGGPHVMIIKKPNQYMGGNSYDAPAGFVVDFDGYSFQIGHSGRSMDVVDSFKEYSSEEQCMYIYAAESTL